jgi:predicted GH43/DUF377 family glycosyl hydrolase
MNSITNTSFVVLLIYIAAIIICLLAIYLLYQLFVGSTRRQIRASHKVKRHHANPVMSPRAHQEWEIRGTFNPAAVEDDEGNVHLLYRALGENGLSNIGHASSKDGINIDSRSSFPVYQPAIEERITRNAENPPIYHPAIYTSGGGWGGYEDPRTVKIGNRVYMTYTAFQGWESVRIGLTSIDVGDLRKHRWNWRKPRLISPLNEVHKNWVLFPEKINGKYAILHGLVPKILIDYVDDLDAPIRPIKSMRPQGIQPGREAFWDNLVRGAGPPPIRTEKGWLLLYHGLDKREYHRYKLGAMLLDLDDPTKILYRSPEPILEPDMHYENDWKPGIVYASGALVRNGQLMIYYGGGDKHACVAQTPLNELLDWLVVHGTHTGV